MSAVHFDRLNGLIARGFGLPPNTIQADIELRPGELPLVRARLLVTDTSADGEVALSEIAKSYRLMPIDGEVA